MRKRLIFAVSVVVAVFLLFACNGGGDSYQKAVDLYNEGVDLHDSDPDQALAKYQESLNHSNDIGEVYLNMGLIYINRGDYSKGEEYTKKGLETFERTQKKVSESQTLERLMAICNNNLGVIYLRKIDETSDESMKKIYHQKCLSYFQEAMRIDPEYTTARNNYNANQTLPEPLTGGELYDEGVDYLDAEKYDLAIARFKSAIKKDPSIGEAYLNIGLCYLRTGDYDQTIKWSEDAVDTFKTYNKTIASGQTQEQLIAISFLNMGLAYIGKARMADSDGKMSDAKRFHRKALESFDQGAKEDPTYSHIKKVRDQYKTSYK